VLSRTSAAIAAAAVIVTAGLTPADSAHAEDPRPAAPETARAVADEFVVKVGSPGNRIHHWGYDLKQAGKAEELVADPEKAVELFGSGAMNVLRIPIHAEGAWVAAGKVVRSRYATVVRAIDIALDANPDLVLYASRMSVENAAGRWYDDSLKSGPAGGRYVDMTKYGAFLADYVRFVNHQLQVAYGHPGAQVQVLGPDNEPSRKRENEGNLTPTRWAKLAAVVRTRLAADTPKLIMNDSAVPEVDWLRTAHETFKPHDAWQPLSYAGTHYQSLLRGGRLGTLRRFSVIARDVGTPRKNLTPWETEFHWDDSDGTGDRGGDPDQTNGEFYTDSRAGLLAGFDHVDTRYDGVVWWSFRSCRDGERHTCATTKPQAPKWELMSALVDSSAGYPKVQVDDGDGEAAAEGTVTTRAFLDGATTYLWIVNDTGRWYLDRRIRLAGRAVTSAPTYELWRSTTATKPLTKRSTAGTARLDGSTALYNVPPRSMTLLTLR
jgi:hypothetical protein